MTDSQIIEGILNSNQQALNEVYTKYRNEFFFHVHKKFKHVDHESAQDVFSDTILALRKNILSGKYELRNNTKLKTYLFQIGENQILNLIRRQSKTISLQEMQILDETEPIGKHNEIEAKENIVNAAIQKLNAECSKLLTMVYWQRIKYEDVFESLGYSSVDSIKTQKYKCFKKLEVIVKQDLLSAQLIY